VVSTATSWSPEAIAFSLAAAEPVGSTSSTTRPLQSPTFSTKAMPIGLASETVKYEDASFGSMKLTPDVPTRSIVSDSSSLSSPSHLSNGVIRSPPTSGFSPAPKASFAPSKRPMRGDKLRRAPLTGGDMCSAGQLDKRLSIFVLFRCFGLSRSEMGVKSGRAA
jgi:hypothetical protein